MTINSRTWIRRHLNDPFVKAAKRDGYASRAAAVPIIIIMIVAIVSTKIPILLGREWWIFSLRDLDRYGFLSFTHETRTDWAMLMGAIFMLLSGSGRWSLDARLSQARPAGDSGN